MKATAEDPLEKRIIMEVCDYLHLDYFVVMSTTRNRSAAKARMMSMFFIMDLGHTMTAVGEMFKRDHTTVINALKTLKERIDKDKIYRNQFFELKDRVSCLIDPRGEKSSFDVMNDELDDEAEMMLNWQNVYQL